MKNFLVLENITDDIAITKLELNPAYGGVVSPRDFVDVR